MNIDELLQTELLTLGDRTINLATAFAAVVILLASFVVSSVIRRALDRMRTRGSASSAAALYIVSQVARYVIVFVGLVVAGSTLGLDLSTLSLFAGAIGVGIGLGLQDIVRNFLSGLILMFDRSIEIGDFIEMDAGVAGSVSAIGARATTIVTNDNVDVLIPNAVLISGPLTNWTRNRVTRRVHVPFDVAYGADLEAVQAAAIEAAHAVAFTLPDDGQRRTQVWLIGFGDSALRFELLVWPDLEAVKRPGAINAAYNWAIYAALQRRGIEIPFPQRDLHLRSAFGLTGEAAIAALKNKQDAAVPLDTAPAIVKPLPRNDAEEDVKQ
ncbi:MAG: mechanosensitive ion channel [Hyphomonas sp.]|uniref:mechanosensitive ion channel family protein n=1 Tax=Hyphomonas sp. TaxID=87 RepID=UPI00179D92B5|nr:mechanosensitive ion channel domain-containing protein [Hyphomonas sp.]MBA3069717.1 mechanosensitive ion channel [Hyphomonas sp.]MBU4062558.1 mechanosensitive ion channel [Alphaproteobacteria bacterium]MBU4163909.1 mechanosensitive ion channel [Alphaproteobacteria bacterium]